MAARRSDAPPSGSPRRTRRWLFRLVLAGIVLLSATLAVELLLRLLWTPPAPFDKFCSAPLWRSAEPYTFEPIPGFEGRFGASIGPDAPPSAQFEPRLIDVRINSLGLRGPELGRKAPGERRVVFCGDSLTFGHGLDHAETFPELAAAMLRDRGIAATACNAGVPGYGFRATCMRLGRLAQPLAADALVAAYFLGNDFPDDVRHRTCIVVNGHVFDGPFGNLMRSSWRGRLSVHCRFALYVETWLVEHYPSASLLPFFRQTPAQRELHAALPPGATIGGLFLDAAPGRVLNPGARPVVDAWLADVDESLALLSALSRRVPVVVVVLPSQYQIDRDLRAKVLAESGLDEALLEVGSAQRHLLELCERRRLPCIDVTPALLGAGTPASLYDYDHVHLAPRGSRVVAGEIAERLARLL